MSMSDKIGYERKRGVPNGALGIYYDRHSGIHQAKQTFAYVICLSRLALRVAEHRVLYMAELDTFSRNMKALRTVRLFLSTNSFCFSTGSELIPMTCALVVLNVSFSGIE